jgi:stage V sporulation protein AF
MDISIYNLIYANGEGRYNAVKVFSEKLSAGFEDNIKMMDDILRVEENFDMIKREMVIADKRVVMYYIDGFVKAEMMQKLMLYFVTLDDVGEGKEGSAESFAKRNVPSVEVEVTGDVDNIVLMVMSGCTAFFSEGFADDAIIIDARSYPARDAQEPENDRVMRGSRDGFVETMVFNTAMIRRRIRDTSFTVKYLNSGIASRTDMALCYMSDKADLDYVKKLENKLTSLTADSFVMGHESVAESLIRSKWYNPFPKIRTTERPDAAAATILEGGIVLICDTSPEAMIFPTSIFDFLQESDDYYFPPLTGSYLRIIRHGVFWITMLLTPIWYLLLQYESAIPAWLAFIVPQDMGAVPILLQLFLTEFALDGLKLASLNTPSVLSNSLSVVGGLILGDFAVKVGWLCPDVIFYMAFVGISNFTQSSYELGYAFKYVRMMLLLLTALFKIWGFAAGILITVILVATNKTVDGKHSYLYPLIPWNGRELVRLLFRVKKPME